MVSVLSNSGHDILISPSHVVKIFKALTYVILSAHVSLPAGTTVRETVIMLSNPLVVLQTRLEVLRTDENASVW
jgi:hypothetical protein